MTPQKDEKKYQIALSLIDGVGDIVGKKLLAQFGSAKGVFFAKRKELEKIHGIGSILVDAILSTLEQKYKREQITTIDGLKIDFEDGWVHLRKSNTESIIRIYAESEGEEKANAIAQKMINEIKELI